MGYSLEVLVFFLLLAVSCHDFQRCDKKIPSSYGVEILGQRGVAVAQFCMNGHDATTPGSESRREVQNNVTFALFGVRRIPWIFVRFSGGSFFEVNFISKK